MNVTCLLTRKEEASGALSEERSQISALLALIVWHGHRSVLGKLFQVGLGWMLAASLLAKLV